MPSRSSTVGTMSMMCAYCVRTSPLRLDAVRPGDDERVADAAAVGLPLPAPERRVAGPRPAPRVVVEVLRAADLVDDLEAVLERLRGVVEELRLVGGAGRAALGARAVVGDHHDRSCCRARPARSRKSSSRPEVVVGVAQEAGEDLHHRGCTAGARRRAASPSRGRPGRAATAPRRRDDPQLLLPREHPLAVGVPAVVELPGVPVRPLLRDVVRRVRGAEARGAGRTACRGRPAWRRR